MSSWITATTAGLKVKASHLRVLVLSPDGSHFSAVLQLSVFQPSIDWWRAELPVEIKLLRLAEHAETNPMLISPRLVCLAWSEPVGQVWSVVPNRQVQMASNWHQAVKGSACRCAAAQGVVVVLLSPQLAVIPALEPLSLCTKRSAHLQICPMLPSQGGCIFVRKSIAWPLSEGKRSPLRSRRSWGERIDRRRKEIQDALWAFGCVMSFPTGKPELAGKCLQDPKHCWHEKHNISLFSVLSVKEFRIFFFC